MNPFAFFVTESANALSQAALLFFLGSDDLDLRHHAHRQFCAWQLYMLGAFIGYTAARLSGSFWLALLVAPLLVGGFGALFEMGILRRLYRRDASAFLMVTFGLALVMGEIIRLTWGPEALQVAPPRVFSGIVFLMGQPFPTYRLFLAGAGILVALAIWQFLDRTRLGLLIRATSQNAEMVHALGTDVNLVRLAVFGIGCGLAGIGGVLAAPLVTASIGMAAEMIIDAFVIVIIGGMGSFLGSLIAAIVIAFVQVFGEYYLPDLALAFMYLVMLLVLVVRPGGLLGKEA